MAKGKKTGGSDFQPGNKLGKGRPPLPDDIKEARKLNQIELERIVNRYLWLPFAEMQQVVKDPSTPMMEVMVARIISEAARKGDQQRLEFILCRLIGKVKDQLEVTTPEPFILKRPSGEEIVMGVKVEEKE